MFSIKNYKIFKLKHKNLSFPNVQRFLSLNKVNIINDKLNIINNKLNIINDKYIPLYLVYIFLGTCKYRINLINN